VALLIETAGEPGTLAPAARALVRETSPVVGLPCALVAAGLVRGFLHGVSPLDPRVLAASAAVAVVMGLLASAVPAWRAVRTDPARVLRLE
jgi:ABC-type antimicrobial peptide transport system permease subunit